MKSRNGYISPKKRRIAEHLKKIYTLTSGMSALDGSWTFDEAMMMVKKDDRLLEEVIELAYEIGGIRFMEYCKGLFLQTE